VTSRVKRTDLLKLIHRKHHLRPAESYIVGVSRRSDEEGSPAPRREGRSGSASGEREREREGDTLCGALGRVVVATTCRLRARYVWDDEAHVTNNPALLDARGLARSG